MCGKSLRARLLRVLWGVVVVVQWCVVRWEFLGAPLPDGGFCGCVVVLWDMEFVVLWSVVRWESLGAPVLIGVLRGGEAVL